MASLFNGLNIGYTGLTASQIGINTTSHNISNAETEGYTRQRVVQQTTTPLGTLVPGAQGNGTQVGEIVRIHDEFVFSRYRSESERKEYTDFQRQTLEETSTYFPEIDNVGIKFDMQEYFNLWGDLSNNPDNEAIKVALANQTTVLSADISSTRDQLAAQQSTINDQLKTAVDEINRIGAEIANLTASINETESLEGQHANDLRDQRGALEVSLAKLVDATVFEGTASSDMGTDYTINVAGFNIVDGTSFHPIVIDNKDNPNGFYQLSYERQDGVLIPMDESIKGGQVGAILDLRGSSFDADGNLEDGQLQEIINELDGFAAGLIESTNNLYAQAAQTQMTSDEINVAPTETLLDTELNISAGDFDIIAYDTDGNEVARRTVTIDGATTMDDGTNASIVGSINDTIDDNNDGNANNDINSILTASYTAGKLDISVDPAFAGYTFAVVDNQTDGLASGTNFAGAIGLSRYYDGDSAKNIDLASDLKNDPSLIQGNKSPVDGNNELANDMLQLQFENVDFTANGVTTSDTLYGYYDALVTDVGTRTNAAITTNDTVTAKYNAVVQSYESVSKVDIDEEMVNLIKYQTAYGAAAKIITTIDQMMDTLLGLKR